MDKLNLTYFADPGHSWLRVPIRLVKELGLYQKISSYSYREGSWAYLEEDCDAPMMIMALETSGMKFEVSESFSNEYSFVRGLERFRSE
jgi:hypothetical protein